MTPSGTFTVLHSFLDGVGGVQPTAQLLEATDGSFYGTTLAGGLGNGAVFKLTPDGNFVVLHQFAGPSNGTGAIYPMIEGSDGNFYGTTANSIFQITPAGEFRLLHRVVRPAERDRYGSALTRLVEGNDGNFYGIFKWGFSNGGVFRLNSQRAPCVNVVELIYQGPLYLRQVIKSERPALWGAWFVSELGLKTLWLGPIPAITPTKVFELYYPAFPRIGVVGVFSLLITSQSEVCADWATVDTGGAGPSAEELRRLMISKGFTLPSP